MKLKPAPVSAVPHKAWTVPAQTVILEECVSFVCLCQPCVTVQVESVGSVSFIACVCVCLCLTLPGSTAECRRGHVLRLGVSPLLSYRRSSLRREGVSTAPGGEIQTSQTFPSTGILLHRICWLSAALWDLARRYLAVDNARKGQ